MLNTKALKRADALQRCHLIAPESRLSAAKEATHNLLLYLSRREFTGFLALYAPMGDELQFDFNEIEQRYPTAFPFRDSKTNQMAFSISSASNLVYKIDFGPPILAPRGSDHVLPDAIVIPGLLFSKEGARLGRGRGYYDKYLENFNGYKIGYCYEQQLEESLITASHDIFMDVIVTPRQILEFKA